MSRVHDPERKKHALDVIEEVRKELKEIHGEEAMQYLKNLVFEKAAERTFYKPNTLKAFHRESLRKKRLSFRHNPAV